MGEILRKFLGQGNEILILSLLIILGLVFSLLAKKIKLPKITGYIMAGFVIGDPLLHLISHRNFESLQNINLVALGLMSITIGAHLNFHKLKNSGKRVISVLLFESMLAFLLVFAAMYFFAGKEVFLALLVASFAIETAPAATVAVVKETKSKGLLVNTLLPVVAMNNVLCILFFGIVSNIFIIQGSVDSGFVHILFLLGKELFIAVLLGVISGYLLKYFAEKNIHSSGQVLTLVLLTVLTTTGISQILKINSMLPCMVIGIVISNTSSYRSTILNIFEELEYVIMIIFFALAGAHINLAHLATAGVVGILYFFARSMGKIAGGALGAMIAGAPKRVYMFIGPSLLSHAGVAIGLVIMASGIRALDPYIDFLTTLVLAVVALNELVGPPLTRWSLSKSGDVGQDRPKLIEFLQEDYIIPNLKATTKEDAIIEMIDFFGKSHKFSKGNLKKIKESVFYRESQGSTGIGRGIAIPHGLVSSGPIILGVLGFSHQGVEFDALDQKPVHLIILIVTPENHKTEMHLAVLSEISKFLKDESIIEKLMQTKDAAGICDVLFEKESKDFNYFID